MDAKYLKYIPKDDVYLFNTGSARKAWLCFGCRYIPALREHRFIVWAPNARAVSLVGDFNAWNDAATPLEKLEGGIWAAFVPGLSNGALYKYCVIGADGRIAFIHSDLDYKDHVKLAYAAVQKLHDAPRP